jgi:hypothetical protein
MARGGSQVVKVATPANLFVLEILSEHVLGLARDSLDVEGTVA